MGGETCEFCLHFLSSLAFFCIRILHVYDMTMQVLETTVSEKCVNVANRIGSQRRI